MKLEVIELQVRPIVSVRRNVWISNKRCSDGGYFRMGRVRFPDGKITVIFRARVNIPLTPNAVYLSNEDIQFVATDTETITNRDFMMNCFVIPTHLECVYSPVIEV